MFSTVNLTGRRPVTKLFIVVVLIFIASASVFCWTPKSSNA